MTVHRYGVLDKNNVKINTITADDELLKTDWYPGYGSQLVDEGVVPPDPLPEPPPPRPKTWGEVIPELSIAMEMGDQLDLKTLNVTKAADLILVDVNPISLPPERLPPQ